ncbi:retrovirus-related pol polyprotein from transposon TNT 1-94 [Tanacetum coccineum]
MMKLSSFILEEEMSIIDMSSYSEESNACFFAKASPSVNWLWHKRLSHLNFENINKLTKQNLVAGLPSLTFSKDKNCSACEKGKHHRASFKTKWSFSINKCLHLLHMDLFGPVKPRTISHNKYTLVIVDEKMENLNEIRVKDLRSDNETEFRNHKLEEFCDENGISQNFSSPCTYEQNGGEAVNTACYTQNRSIIVKWHGKTAYDVFRRRSPYNNCFYIFGCPVHIHNHRDHLGKFNENADDGFFLGYSLVAKAFRVFNIRRQEMEKTYHATFSEDDEAISQSSTKGDAINFNENRSFPDDEFLEPRSKDFVSPEEPPELSIADDHPTLSEHDHPGSGDNLAPDEIQDNVINEQISEVQPSTTTISPSAEVFLQPSISQDRRSRENHSELVNIICEPLAGITTRSKIRDSEAASAHECLNMVWTLVPKPRGKPIIRTKWIWKNKMDENEVVIKNKILEGVYVQQPHGFESSEFLNHVCKSDKALYELKQAPKAWGCQILGGKLVCWSAKKQSFVAMSSAEAEYVVVAGCCAQVLWIKSHLADYDVLYDKCPKFHVNKKVDQFHFK